MNCNEATPLVSAFADGEIDGLRSHSIRKHLAGCAECTAKYEALLALRGRLRTEVPYFVASPALRARVGAIAAQASEASITGRGLPRTFDRWRWLAGGAVAGCVATVLVWMLGTAVLQWRGNEDLGLEAIAAHSRATLGQHMIEVASADQHTVKPWLSSRLDFSPPVADLVNEGFPLLGARLDYLAGHPVAVLVYGYRQHTIDVFMRPGLFHGSSSALRSVRGFNVARAAGFGIDWLAVSDVNAEVLAPFVQRLAGNPATN
jgi:anti-sigma factor RsiW